MLKRAYTIITAEIHTIKREDALQAAVWAVNNTTGLEGFLPVLAVFRAYLRIVIDSPLSATQI